MTMFLAYKCSTATNMVLGRSRHGVVGQNPSLRSTELVHSAHYCTFCRCPTARSTRHTPLPGVSHTNKRTGQHHVCIVALSLDVCSLVIHKNAFPRVAASVQPAFALAYADELLACRIHWRTVPSAGTKLKGTGEEWHCLATPHSASSQAHFPGTPHSMEAG